MAACGGERGDVASVVSDAMGEGSVPEGLSDVADAMCSCLVGEGIPAIIAPGPDGEFTLVRFEEDVSVAWRLPGDYSQFTDAVSDRERAEFSDNDEIIWNWSTRESDGGHTLESAALSVSGVDRSGIFLKCIEGTGYDEQKVEDSVDFSRAMASFDVLVVSASNEWARCARENGWPTVADAHPTGGSIDRDSYSPPITLLPPTILEHELDALLAACPNFRAEVEVENDRIYKSMSSASIRAGTIPKGVQAQPNVGFDFPGFDGKGVQGLNAEGPGDEDTPTREKLARLRLILERGEREFWAGVEVDSSGKIID
jgi:hypothetical protein